MKEMKKEMKKEIWEKMKGVVLRGMKEMNELLMTKKMMMTMMKKKLQ
jgi:hypothetical protein